MNNLEEIIKETDEEIKNNNLFFEVEEIENYYSDKIIQTFKKYQVSTNDFFGTTGYGYNDVGRDKIDLIFSDILDGEKALVRSQFISGTHALTVTLFGLLRPNDKLLSISGKPYDTLDEVIGIKENNSSLKSFNIFFDYIDLVNDDFDYDKIKNYLENNIVKVIEIQRSRGYANRSSIDLDKIKKVVDLIKSINKEIIIMVDNCYCELTSILNPVSKEIGCDIMVGSLIKNLGGGIASNGAYVVGKEELVNLVSERLTVPGQGSEVGPSQNMNKEILEGLYMAPHAVSSSLKTNIFASILLNKLGFITNPNPYEKRNDIVLSIIFNNRDKLIKFVEGIQEYSAIDNYVKPIPSDMPGYSNQIIMASGSFTQGSSIEISCDGPLCKPFIAYLQGSLTYSYGKLAVINATRKVLNNEEK